MKNITVCFSGHRESRLPDAEKLKNMTANLKKEIERSIKEGYTNFISGGCSGFDLCAAECVIELKKKYSGIRLIIAVPFAGHQKGFSEEESVKYQRVEAECDEIIILQPKFRRGCYHARNRYMADRSSRLICYYDGLGGGTEYTVKYSEKSGLEVINVF